MKYGKVGGPGTRVGMGDGEGGVDVKDEKNFKGNNQNTTGGMRIVCIKETSTFHK